MGINLGSVFGRGSRSRSGLPAFLPPSDLFVSDIGPPGAWKVLFLKDVTIIVPVATKFALRELARHRYFL